MGARVVRMAVGDLGPAPGGHQEEMGRPRRLPRESRSARTSANSRPAGVQSPGGMPLPAAKAPRETHAELHRSG
jgi:hypothetical protein